MPESIGEYLTESFVQGVQELQAANAGEMAMDAPPIQAAEQSYEDMLAQASNAQAPAMEQGQGMEM